MKVCSAAVRLSTLLLGVAAILSAAESGARTTRASEAALAQEEQFLRTAPIIARKAIGVGITHTERVTLSNGPVTHDAHVQHIDVFKPLYKTTGYTEKNFHDSYKYNIAAYRLAKLLGIDMTPPCVYREVDGKPASVCWWVDNVQFDEKTRREKNLEPPDDESWTRQLNLVRVFDQFIDNIDRTQENLLIDKDWNVWMIDHSRSFRVTYQLRKPDVMHRVSMQMLAAMRQLTEAECDSKLKPFLTDAEIKALLVRRDLVLKYFANRVDDQGEAAVFLDIPRSTPHVTIP